MPSPRDSASGTMFGPLIATPAATAGHLRSRTGLAPAAGASSKRESYGLSVAGMASMPACVFAAWIGAAPSS